MNNNHFFIAFDKLPLSKSWGCVVKTTSHALTLQQLEIFEAIARRGSFAKAAEALSMSQPAVSYHLRQLEAILGTRLIERASRSPLRLTAPGRRLLVTCDAVIEQVERGTQEIQSLRRAEAGTIAFGARPLFYDYVFPPLYASFRKRHPEVTVAAETGSRDELIERLIRRDLDLAVLLNRVDDARLANYDFAASDLVVVAPPDHPLAHDGAAISFARFAQEPLIRPSNSNSFAWQVVEAEAKKRSLRLSFSWRAEDAEAQMNAVRSGLGLAALPLYAVATAINNGTLARLTVEGFPMRFQWYLVTSGAELPPLVELFKQHLLSEVRTLDEFLCLPEPSSFH